MECGRALVHRWGRKREHTDRPAGAGTGAGRPLRAAGAGAPAGRDPRAAGPRRLARPAVRVVVAGQAGKGKSALVNVLVGAPVCGVAGDTVPIGPSGLSTPVPTVVRGGPAPTGTLVLTRPAQPGEPERTAVPVENLATQLVRLADDAH